MCFQHSSISSFTDGRRVKLISGIEDCKRLQKTLRKSVKGTLLIICFSSYVFERIRYTFSNGSMINRYLTNDGFEITESNI